MTISYPRTFPADSEIRISTWKPVLGVALNRYGNGKAVSAVDQYDPWFRAEFQTVPLAPQRRRVWSAWRNSLRGGMKSFLAYDAMRSFPLAYPAGVPSIIAGTWNGSGITTALSARGMTVEGVAAGYQASVGDHVGLVQDGKYSVHEIVEAAAADGSGDISIIFEPYVVLTMFSIGATAVFWRPKARFILDHETWEDDGDIEFTPISFVGLQVF